MGCSELDPKTFERFYRQVLEPAFRPDELVELDQMAAALLAGDDSEFGTVLLRDGDPVAGILGETWADSGVVLLGYIAVRPDLRGSGLGGQLLATELPRWQARAPESLVLGEVDDPRFHASTSHGDPLARLRFYDRLGARLLPVPYIQPALRPTADRVRGMLLISMGTPRDSVAADAVARFFDDYFEACESAEVIRSDPEYRALRERLSGWPDGRLPLWPLMRYPEVRPLVIEGDRD